MVSVFTVYIIVRLCNVYAEKLRDYDDYGSEEQSQDSQDDRYSNYEFVGSENDKLTDEPIALDDMTEAGPLNRPNYIPNGPNYRPNGPNYRPNGPNYRPNGPNYRPNGPPRPNNNYRQFGPPGSAIGPPGPAIGPPGPAIGPPGPAIGPPNLSPTYRTVMGPPRPNNNYRPIKPSITDYASAIGPPRQNNKVNNYRLPIDLPIPDYASAIGPPNQSPNHKSEIGPPRENNKLPIGPPIPDYASAIGPPNQSPNHKTTIGPPIPDYASAIGPPNQSPNQRTAIGPPIPDYASAIGPPNQSPNQRTAIGPPIPDYASAIGPPNKSPNQRTAIGPPIPDYASAIGPPNQSPNQRTAIGPPRKNNKLPIGPPIPDYASAIGPPNQNRHRLRRSNLNYPDYDTLDPIRHDIKRPKASSKRPTPKWPKYEEDPILDEMAAYNNQNNKEKPKIINPKNNKKVVDDDDTPQRVNIQIMNFKNKKKRVIENDKLKIVDNTPEPLIKQTINLNKKMQLMSENLEKLSKVLKLNITLKRNTLKLNKDDRSEKVYNTRFTKPITLNAKPKSKSKLSTAIQKQVTINTKHEPTINDSAEKKSLNARRVRHRVWKKITYNPVESALGYSPTDQMAEFEKAFEEPGQFQPPGDGYPKFKKEQINSDNFDDNYRDEMAPGMIGAGALFRDKDVTHGARKDLPEYGDYGGGNMARGPEGYDPGMGPMGPAGRMGPSGPVGPNGPNMGPAGSMGPGGHNMGPGDPMAPGGPGGGHYPRGPPGEQPDYGNRPSGMGPYGSINGGQSFNPGVPRYGPNQAQMGPSGYRPGPGQMPQNIPETEVPDYPELMERGQGNGPSFNREPMGYPPGNQGPNFRPVGDYPGLPNSQVRLSPQRNPMPLNGPGMGRPGFSKGYYKQQTPNYAARYGYGQMGPGSLQGLTPGYGNSRYNPGQFGQAGPYGYGPKPGYDPRNYQGNYPGQVPGNPAGQLPGNYGPGFRPGGANPRNPSANVPKRKPPANSNKSKPEAVKKDDKNSRQGNNADGKTNNTKTTAEPKTDKYTEATANTTYNHMQNALSIFLATTTTPKPIKYKTTTINPDYTLDPIKEYEEEYDPFGTTKSGDANTEKTESTKSEAEVLSSLVDSFDIRPKFAFIDEYKKLNQDRKYGVFTNFVVHIMDVMSKKDAGSIDRLVTSFDEVYERYYTKRELTALGEPFGMMSTDYIRGLVETRPDELRSTFTLFHHAVNDRKLYLPDDLNIFLDFLDKIYADDEERALDVLHTVYEYPANRNLTSHDICDGLMKTLCFNKLKELAGDEKINTLTVTLNTMLANRFGGRVEITTQTVTRHRRMNLIPRTGTTPKTKVKQNIILLNLTTNSNVTSSNLTLNSTWPEQKKFLTSAINDTVGRLKNAFKFVQRTNSTKPKPVPKGIDFEGGRSSEIDEIAMLKGTRRLIDTRRSRHSHSRHRNKNHRHRHQHRKKHHGHNTENHRKRKHGIHGKVKDKIHKYDKFMDRLERGTRESHLKREPASVISDEDLKHHHRKKHHDRHRHKHRSRHHGRKKHRDMRREKEEDRISVRDLDNGEGSSESDYPEANKHNEPNNEELPPEPPPELPQPSVAPKRPNFFKHALRTPPDNVKDYKHIPDTPIGPKKDLPDKGRYKQGIFAKPPPEPKEDENESEKDSLALDDKDSSASTFSIKIDARKMGVRPKRRRRRNILGSGITLTSPKVPKVAYPFNENLYNIIKIEDDDQVSKKTNASAALRFIKRNIIRRIKKLSKGLATNFKQLARNLSAPSNESDEHNICKSNILKAVLNLRDVTKNLPTERYFPFPFYTKKFRVVTKKD